MGLICGLDMALGALCIVISPNTRGQNCRKLHAQSAKAEYLLDS